MSHSQLVGDSSPSHWARLFVGVLALQDLGRETPSPRAPPRDAIPCMWVVDSHSVHCRLWIAGVE